MLEMYSLRKMVFTNNNDGTREISKEEFLNCNSNANYKLPGIYWKY
jgi:hypothetical protein